MPYKAKNMAPKHQANVIQTLIDPPKRLKGKEKQIVKDIRYRK